ncbi:MAG: ThiF family adenylyltransferase [Flavobacteriales bacterium]|jgi:molybdopterin/thiamine biosynthesis adenylyltransferase|nr:ThiF family adenylyltransferase [Flavobacteriales bacterium]
MKGMATARVAVIGAGALGGELLHRLLGLHVQFMSLFDGDRVEAGNLVRQRFYTPDDIGSLKADAFRAKLETIAPYMELNAESRFIDAGNATVSLSGHDLIADCTDDLHAKNLLDRACSALAIPLVSGALHRDQGQVLLLHARSEGIELSRADVYAGRIGPDQDGCDMQQVPMDTIEAVAEGMSRTIASLLRGEQVVNGSLDLYDGGERRWITFKHALTC